MRVPIERMTDAEVHALRVPDEAGLGALRTERGNLPLERLDLRARITGLLAHSELEQGFRNPYDEPLEATYVFPLPDRAAVTGMRMTADDRTVEARLSEREQARADYDRAIAAGRRAAIAEEERPDVFTMRVGNILPGERVTVTLTLAGPLQYEDGEATFRFPLVVAPRYIPGAPSPDGPVGDGYAPDTDAVPDASRITPPVLLPGFPSPVRLGIEVTVDSAGLSLAQARCSYPTEPVPSGGGGQASGASQALAGQAGPAGVRVVPGERADRDLVLRLRYADPVHSSHALALCPDPDGPEGTFQLTLLPPAQAAPARPRDVVVVLDRSGSMRGWKMATARRAAARIVDTLTTDDRFAVLTFDTTVERPVALGTGLATATDRHRFQAVEHLAAVEARGGTELLTPLRDALALLTADSAGTERDRVLVLVTDGQVGNEDQILREHAEALARVRVHTIGIDRAVNAGFLGRLAATGGGRCELVESEDRLDEAADRIHRRIGAPLVTGLRWEPEGLEVLTGTVAPARTPDLFPGAPVVLTGRYRGPDTGRLRISGTGADGSAWEATVEASVVDSPAVRAVWARSHLRDLEDRYVAAARSGTAELERRIVETSLRFGVLCRFTAYVATDTRVVTDGGTVHRVIQPVESPAGWEPPVPPPAPAAMMPGAGPSMLAAGLPPAAAGPAAAAGRQPAGQPPRLSRMVAARRSRGGGPPFRWPPLGVFAAEAVRLRALARAPEPERRAALADLASRLEAMLRSGRSPEGAAGGPMARLFALLDALRDDAPLRMSTAEFEAVWRRMLGLLDELGRGASTPSPLEPPAPPAKPRPGPFWKRT